MDDAQCEQAVVAACSPVNESAYISIHCVLGGDISLQEASYQAVFEGNEVLIVTGRF